MSAIAKGSTSRASPDWITIGCLAHRTLVTPIVLAAGVEVLGDQVQSYVIVVGIVSLFNLIGALSTKSLVCQRLLRSAVFLVADLMLTAALNLIPATLLPADTVLLPYRDVFWLYATSTAALWAHLRGARVGAALLLAGCGLHLAMAWVNGVPLGRDSLVHIAARLGYLVLSIVLPLFLDRLSQLGESKAAEEGRRAGHVIERIRALRATHDSALQALAQISQRSASDIDSLKDLQLVKDVAVTQIAMMRTAIDSDDETRRGLLDGMQHLVRSFGVRGLHIELVFDIGFEPVDEISSVLISATGEALANVLQHSGVKTAVVRASANSSFLTISVRDHGKGFDPKAVELGFGLRHSIIERIEEVDGRAAFLSEAGKGTRVDLSVPRQDILRQRHLSASGRAVLHGFRENAEVETVASSALGWLVVAALSYRIAIGPLQALTVTANLQLSVPGPYLTISSLVLGVDAALLVLVLLGRLGSALKSWTLLVFDCGVIVGLSLWSAVILPNGTALLPGTEILWTYTVGTVVLWTALRGFQVGLVVGMLAIVVQFVMATANGASVNGDGLLQIASRSGWVAVALILSWFIAASAKNAARGMVSEGIRAGRVVERVWVIRDIYELAIASFERIVSLVDEQDKNGTDQSRRIRGTALIEIDRLRAIVDSAQLPRSGTLVTEFEHLALSFRARGIRIELVASELSISPPANVVDIAKDCLNRAIELASSHDGASHVVVRAFDLRKGFEVVVRTQGSENQLSLREVVDRERDIRLTLESIGGLLRSEYSISAGSRISIRWLP